ncbi:MAG: type II secretion system F family protein [Acidimicrobiales bacterium]
MTVGLLAAACAGYGTFLLYTALVLDWRNLRPPQSRRRRRLRFRARLDAAGLGDLATTELAGSCAVSFLVASAVTFALFGGIPAALIAGAFSASLPPAAYRARRQRRYAVAQHSWPRLLEELRLLTGSVGRSIPQALLEVGRRSPQELRPAFAAAERTWLLTTDFDATAAVLRHRLADPAADIITETLVVAHHVGGADLDRRLADLIEDRVIDLEGRKDAQTKQAGVRFARRFVLAVPLGMAAAGLSIGTGRSAYETAGGQAAVVFGILAVVACWVWSGRLLRLPREPRVFAGDPQARPPANNGATLAPGDGLG